MNRDTHLFMEAVSAWKADYTRRHGQEPSEIRLRRDRFEAPPDGEDLEVMGMPIVWVDGMDQLDWMSGPTGPEAESTAAETNLPGDFDLLDRLSGGDPLTRWFVETALSDAERTAPKTAEYGGASDGSADLRVMGFALAELCGMHDAPEAVKLELACWFYALGKIARLVSDYKQGKPGKADTWFDLSVYSMMARRIQETGSW